MQGATLATEEAPLKKIGLVGGIAWLSTVVAFLVIALVLFLDNYQGYPAVALAIAVAAAINLF